MIRRWREQPAAVQDLALAVVLGAAWFGSTTYWQDHGWHPADVGAWDLAGVASVLMLALRTVAPPGVLVAGVLAYPVLYGLPLQTEFHLLPVLVVAYVAARRPPVWAAAVGLACLAAGALLSSGVVHMPVRARPVSVFDWSRIVYGEFAVGAMLTLGVVTAAHRRAAAALAARNDELERLRAVEAEQAVALERTRIASELHDDVAHHLTGLIVRAQAAERVAPSRPQVAVDSVGWFAETARYALTAMRRTVSVLRDGGAARLAPGPSLDDLPAMVARVRDAGLAVSLDVDDPLPPLEPQVQHAVVRVVQESLTNVLRHARAHRAVVTLGVREHGLAVVVEDDGADPGPKASIAGGLGIAGMRERAASCGGRLDVDSGTLGGWRVRGWFPCVVPAGRV